MNDQLRILIAAEHASARFGGEAALPLHYFRVLRARGFPVWLVTHARTRAELELLYPHDEQIIYIEDTAWHRFLWRLGARLPDSVSYMTTGFLSRLSTQLTQRKIIGCLVRTQAIDVVHQPMPVSPKEPSMLFGFDAPVVIGPMNGGMDYPDGFARHRGAIERVMLGAGRASAALLNALMPGKRRAARLLVANQRTRKALPPGVCSDVEELVENGVDLGLWRPCAASEPAAESHAATFVFMGRLVDWKAVDLLLEAFAKARVRAPMRLWILGDGSERASLQSMARELGIDGASEATVGTVHFAGWLPQAACAQKLAQGDALVLPSLLECGGAVVLEAMSMGKPVIATAWGGPTDYLDARCGVLVPPKSRSFIVEGFSQALVELATSSAKRRDMGAHGLARVRQEFDWERKVDRMLEIYGEVIRVAQATRANP